MEEILALHPESGLGKSGKWVILLAGPFSLPPEGPSEICAHEGHGSYALSAPLLQDLLAGKLP